MRWFAAAAFAALIALPVGSPVTHADSPKLGPALVRNDPVPVPAPTPAPAPEKPLVEMPAKVTVKVNRLARIPVTCNSGKTLKYSCKGDVDLFREYDPRPNVVVFRFQAYAPGKYTLLAWTADKNGEPTDAYECVIETEEPPPPPAPPVPPAPNPNPGPNPGPSPGPNPSPNPTPVPDGALGLTRATYEASAKLPQAARAKAAKALADGFGGAAAAIAAGVYPKDVESMLRRVKGDNDEKLQDAGVVPSTCDDCAKVLQAKLSELLRAGKLKALTDWQAAFEEIAAGFALVK